MVNENFYYVCRLLRSGHQVIYKFSDKDFAVCISKLLNMCVDKMRLLTNIPDYDYEYVVIDDVTLKHLIISNILK